MENPRIKLILDILETDIKDSNKPYSALTNNQIADKMKISPISVRDMIGRMVSKRILRREENFYSEDGKYYNRVLYKVI